MRICYYFWVVLFIIMQSCSKKVEQNSTLPVSTDETYGRITLSPSKLLYYGFKLPYTMDASWATLKNSDGTLTFFETAMGKSPYYFRHKGTFDNPLKTELEPFKWDYNGFDNINPSGCWLDNIYKISQDTLIGFIHREDLHWNGGNGSPYNSDYVYLGIARSFDGGTNWKYLGDVIGTLGNLSTNQVYAPNLAGMPILNVGDYILVYFDEWDSQAHFRTGISVGRAKLTDLIAAIKQDKICAFKKYNNGSWDEDGLIGIGSNVIPDFKWDYDVHSDAAYCKPLNKYLLTVQTYDNNRLYLYQSSDGINWGEQITLDYQSGAYQPYSCFAGFDSETSDDCNTVGSEFYIYMDRKFFNNDPEQIYYRKVTITP